jgi:hypothetical protein
MFDLHAETKKLLAESNEMDVNVLAAELADRVPPRELRAVLADALVHYVRRATTLDRYPVEVEQPPATAPHIPAQRNRRSGHDNWSPKQNRSRRIYHEYLHKRFRGVDGFKYLADFTLDDLTYAVDYRRTLAAGINERANWLESVAREVKEHEVSKVSELPDDVLTALGEQQVPAVATDGEAV